MKRLAAAFAAFTTAVTAVLTTSAGASPSFGSTPYDVISREAGKLTASQRCNGAITPAMLTAAAMALAYQESGGQVLTQPPFAGALSRGDNTHISMDNIHLYGGNSKSSPIRRAFWHPGVGLFQLDDSGLGTAVGLGRSITSGSVGTVLDKLVRNYCTLNGDYWSGTWRGCSGNICRNNYNQLLVNGGVAYNRVGMTDGGNVANIRTCYFASKPNDKMQCLFVNVPQLVGKPNTQYCGESCATPLEGSTAERGYTPLSFPYYVFNGRRADGRTYEYRYWMRADTGYQADKLAYRAFGTNSRDRDNSIVGDAREFLCDATMNRGACNTPPPDPPACHGRCL